MTLAEDEQRLAAYAAALADAIEAAVGGWVRRNVEWHLHVLDDATEATTSAAADAATEDVAGRVRALLRLDIAEQTTNPLSILRSAVKYPTAVLEQAGVAPIQRDDFARKNFPDDPYGLTPAAFSDVDESLHEPGLVWGAAKAHVHLRRRDLR